MHPYVYGAVIFSINQCQWRDLGMQRFEIEILNNAYDMKWAHLIKIPVNGLAQRIFVRKFLYKSFVDDYGRSIARHLFRKITAINQFDAHCVDVIFVDGPKLS